MVIAKPAPFLTFTPSLEWLENMRGVDAEAEEYIAKKTDFLMEVFKFMPKAAAYKFNKGAMADTGSVDFTSLSMVRINDGGTARYPTAAEVTALLGELAKTQNGIRAIYNSNTCQITHALAEKIENRTATVDDIRVTSLFSGAKEEILRIIKKAYYDGKNQYKDFKAYNEQYAYDIDNPGTQWGPGQNWSVNVGSEAEPSIKNQSTDSANYTTKFPGNDEKKRTYITSDELYGFGVTHRQDNVGAAKGSQLHLSDEYNWFNGAADFKWSPDAVSGINNVVPVYDKNSPKFTGLHNKDFYPTDYTNMIYGLNPMLLEGRDRDGLLTSKDLPDISCYKNIFGTAMNYFSGYSKNYFDIIKTKEYLSYGPEKMTALFILMMESKRRFLYAMTEIFGPFSQGAGFEGYVGRDNYLGSKTPEEGRPVLTANTETNGLKTNFTVDNYMISRFSRFINDPRVQKVSGYKTGFLSIFYENSHEFISFLTAFTQFKALGNDVWKYLRFSYTDGLAIKGFRDLLYQTSTDGTGMWERMMAYVKPTTTIVAGYFRDVRDSLGFKKDYLDASTTWEDINYYIQQAVSKAVEMKNKINPSNFKIPTYHLYRLYDELDGYITRLLEIRNSGYYADTEAAAMYWKKHDAKSVITAIQDITFNTSGTLDDIDYTIKRIEDGSSFLNLRQEFTHTDSTGSYLRAGAYFSRLPRSFLGTYSWDSTSGNFVSNWNQETSRSSPGYISGQNHFYSPVQQKNNFGPGGPSKNQILELTFAPNKTYTSETDAGNNWYKKFAFRGNPYQNVWGTRAIVDLSQAYLYEEIMRFAVKHLWNSPRRRQHDYRRDEYYRQKDKEQEMEKAVERAEKKKVHKAKEALIRSEKKKRAEKKKMQKKMMKEFTEKMKELRAIQRKNSAGTSQKPAKK